MAQSIYAPLEGRLVDLRGTDGAFRLCGHCGFNKARVRLKPAPPHHAALDCVHCGNRTSFLSDAHLAAMMSADRGAA